MKESLACFSRIYFHIVALDLKWWNLLPMHVINSYQKTWVLELFVSLNMFYLRIYSVLTTTTSEPHPKRTWRAIRHGLCRIQRYWDPHNNTPGTSNVRMSWKDSAMKVEGGESTPSDPNRPKVSQLSPENGLLFQTIRLPFAGRVSLFGEPWLLNYHCLWSVCFQAFTTARTAGLYIVWKEEGWIKKYFWKKNYV